MQLKAATVGVAVLALAAPAAAQETYAQARTLSLFNQLIETSTCEAALPTAREFWRSTDFQTQLVFSDQENFLAAVVQCAASLEDGRAAIDAANAAHDLGASWADKIRLELGLSYEDDALAVEAFFDLSRSSPKDFQALESYIAWGALRAAERITGAHSTMLRMHEALAAADYVPSEGFHDDFFRLDHARLLLTDGRVAEARARLEGVVDPQAIMTLRINRIYDPLREDAAFERRLDIAAAGEAAIARARRASEAEPRRLGHIVQLSALLRDVGRSEEALNLVQSTAAVAQAPDGATRFDDLDNQLNWLLFAKADLLADLGRNTEAHTVYSEAMSAGEIGQGNIIIMFASSLNAEGRGADALQVLDMLGRVTPFGDAWMLSERVCAAEIAGNVAVRDEALTALRALETHNPPALMHALLCANQLDDAAALMIRRLANPREREAALVALQPYQRLASRRMPREEIELARLAAVRGRPDVRAAADAVGRIEPTPIYSY